MKDYRRTSKGNIQYSVQELFFVVIVGIICGCDSWEGISLYSRLKLDWFRQHFPYSKGIPSHDTLERFFAKLDSQAFGHCFINWAASVFNNIDNEVVSIDGKRICGSYDKGKGQAALHVVSAYASANRLTLGQVATDVKSNEITAIPALLDLIEVKHTTVSIDAMGCQKEIAKKIRSKDAHYLLAVKENQKELHRNVIQSFKLEPVKDFDNWEDMGHGRIEKRICEVINDLKWLEQKEKWMDLSTLVRIRSERMIKNTGEIQTQTRYYISSKLSSAKDFNRMVRSHWAIENNLHWNLDVVFKEDKMRKRKGSSAFNFNIINKIALKILDKNKGKLTKPLARIYAANDDAYRELLIKSL